MTCADDRWTDEQLDLWAGWAPEPCGHGDEPVPIGPHLWHRRAWRPVEELEIAAAFQTAL